MAQGFFARTWLLGCLLIFRSFVAVLLALRRKFAKYPRKTCSLTYLQSKLPSSRSPNTVDVFYPSSYRMGEGAQKKRPLYIDIHGGGFAVGDPTTDAHFCRYFADAADCVVVSLPYRFSPFTRFPSQVHDLGALASCVLNDRRVLDLVDTTKVACGGFSAGGNLSTAITTLPEMQGKIHALVPFYPLLDFTVTTEEKLAKRPPGYDVLTHLALIFKIGYVPYAQDTSDPLLSPFFAEPHVLPDNIYIVGAELDLLNYDAKAFAEKFQPLKKNLVYEEVKGAQHGFTHQAEQTMNAEMKKKLEKMTSDCYDRIVAWLSTTVWKTNGDTRKPQERAVEELGGEGAVI